MDSLFIPLRSNAAWFASEEAELELEARLKASAILHDSLTFQDGRFSLVVFERGSFDMDISPHAIAGDRSDLSRMVPGKHAQLAIRNDVTGEAHPVLAGPAQSGYKADFYGLLERSGLASRHYCELRDISVSSEGKNQIKAEARPDVLDADLLGRIDVPEWEKAQVIHAAHIDSNMAAYLRQPYLADPRIASFVAAKNGQIARENWELDLRPFILRTLATLTLPDFGALSWDEIHEARESSAGRDLRRYIHALASEVTIHAAELDAPQDVERLIEQRHLMDLAEEVASTRATAGQLVMSLSLNFLPLGGLVGGSSELMRLVEQSHSWLSFIAPRT